MLGAVWVCGGCGWWPVSVVSEGGWGRVACVVGVGGDCKPLDSLCFGAEEGMWAVGAVGVLEERKACGRCVSVVVGGECGEGAESNRTKGAPPNADPGGVGG